MTKSNSKKQKEASYKIRARDISALLRERFGQDNRKYVCASEVGLSTGGAHRRIDFCVMTCYASESFSIEGIEIKVDASDLKHELQEFEKHEAFFGDFDYYSLAIPKEIYDKCKDLIPDGWGIYVVKRRQTNDNEALEQEEALELRCLRKPMPLPTRSEVLSRGFVASFARKAVHDATFPLIAANSKEYLRGYEDGKEAGISQGKLDAQEELLRLSAVKEICDELEADSRLSVYGLQHALNLLKALEVGEVRSIFDALARIHEKSGSAIAALSGKFDLGSWGRNELDDEHVDEDEVIEMIEESDKRRRKIFW